MFVLCIDILLFISVIYIYIFLISITLRPSWIYRILLAQLADKKKIHLANNKSKNKNSK